MPPPKKPSNRPQPPLPDPELPLGNVVNVDLAEEMRENYITYALSVIKARALPDVRDGLKPVHRRILTVMWEGGYRSDKSHVKSASVVGDALKMYHPHGDQSVYDAMVRMAQDFNLRYPLVDGHGNFGSVDGDPPAAYRYTEARMNKLAEEMLADIDKSTVDYQPNFDDSRQEPSVLPSRLPHLLMNGADGIAVGMATSIPPHNLTEIVNATLALLRNRALTDEDLCRYLKGPDFPTGGIIRGTDGIKKAYTTGKGFVDLYAVADIEPMRDRSQIVITQIPYQVNKSNLLEQIREGVESTKLTGISDLRDESDRNGMRIVIECKRDAVPRDVLKRLYKHTLLYKRWHINLLALDTAHPTRDPRKTGLKKLPIRPFNQPRIFTIGGILSAWLDHRFEVILRRTMHDLAEAEARAHILEGLLRALDHIDRIIELIRNSQSTMEARTALMTEFDFSEIQANAILDMQLRRLVGLEREKLQSEYDALTATIADYKDILANDPRVWEIIEKDLQIVGKTYGDPRKTRIENEEMNIDADDLVPKENIIISLTDDGYVKRMPLSVYRTQGRGGRGIKGAKTKGEDVVTQVVSTTTHHNLLIFTDKGRVYGLRAYAIPAFDRTAKGMPIINYISLDSDEKVLTILPTAVGENIDTQYLFFATSLGQIKKTSLAEYDYMPSSGKIAIDLVDQDTLAGVHLLSKEDEIILVTAMGMSIRFATAQTRPMGRDTRGVRGITLGEGDRVVDMAIATQAPDLVLLTIRGYGKRTSVSEFRAQSRGGKGIRCYKVSDATGPVLFCRGVSEDEELILFTSKGIANRQRLEEIRQIGRATKGVRVIRLDEGDSLAAASVVVSEDFLASAAAEEPVAT